MCSSLMLNYHFYIIMTKKFQFEKMTAFGTSGSGRIVTFCDAGGCNAETDCDGGSTCDENA